MKKNNPIVIPRNHKVEEALEAANNSDMSLTNKLLSILNKPYNNQNDIDDYQSPSSTSHSPTFFRSSIIPRHAHVYHSFPSLFPLRIH